MATPRRPRARKIRGQVGPFETNATTFDGGRDRAIEIVRVTPAAIVYRAKGMTQEFILAHSIGFLKAVAIAAGADIDPRQGRVRRGGL